MDTKTINKLLRREKCFIGTYSRDTLPNSIKENQALIVNTDPSDRPGEHWVAILMHSNGKGEYFDSYGLPPLHPEFIKFLDNNCYNGWTFNNTTLQCLSCITCGHFCVAYIKFRCLGHSYNDFISLFAKDLVFNDELINLYVNV